MMLGTPVHQPLTLRKRNSLNPLATPEDVYQHARHTIRRRRAETPTPQHQACALDRPQPAKDEKTLTLSTVERYIEDIVEEGDTARVGTLKEWQDYIQAVERCIKANQRAQKYVRETEALNRKTEALRRESEELKRQLATLQQHKASQMAPINSGTTINGTTIRLLVPKVKRKKAKMITSIQQGAKPITVIPKELPAPWWISLAPRRLI